MSFIVFSPVSCVKLLPVSGEPDFLTRITRSLQGVFFQILKTGTALAHPCEKACTDFKGQMKGVVLALDGRLRLCVSSAPRHRFCMGKRGQKPTLFHVTENNIAL